MAEEEGITVKKSENFSEWYTEVIKKSGLADIRYNVKGFLVHMPWCVKILKLMNGFLERELEKRGHEPFLFPSVIPQSFLEKEKEHAEFSAEVFWITEGGEDFKKLEERLALRPTSETAFYSMFSLWIRSWRDLPMKTYQTCQVWRYESYTRPFIRGREFYWIEAHNAFGTEEEAKKQVEEDREITEATLYKKFCIPFTFFRRPQHDKFKGAVDTYAADTIMPDGKVIQLPSTHFLGQNFAKVFDIKYVDKDGNEKYVWQTCYGPAAWRILAAVIAIHGDDKGLVLPPSIAPYQIVIVPIYYTDEEKEKIIKKCKSIAKVLKKFRVFIDLDEEHTPGWKFNYWELKGVPLRIEIGPKDLENKGLTAVRRDTGKRTKLKEKEVKAIGEILTDIQENLRKRADKFFSSYLHEAKTFDELKDILERKGGIVKVGWCGNKECADNIKSETSGGCIRGTLFNSKEEVKGKCVWCNKPAREIVYVAKQY